MSSDEDDDSDIADLLKQLDGGPEPVVEATPVQSVAASKPAVVNSSEDEEDEDLSAILNRDPSPTLSPELTTASDIRTIPTPVINLDAPTVVMPISEEGILDVKKYVQKAEGVLDEMLNSARNDRQEAQDTIDFLRTQVHGAVSANKPAERWAEALITALEVKSGINATAVKAVEALGKIIAATKITGNVTNNLQVNNGGSGSVSASELKKVLEEPVTDADDFV